MLARTFQLLMVIYSLQKLLHMPMNVNSNIVGGIFINNECNFAGTMRCNDETDANLAATQPST